jgi:hypothetical protein
MAYRSRKEDATPTSTCRQQLTRASTLIPVRESSALSFDGSEEKLNWSDAKATLKDIKLWVHYSTYLAAGSGATSLSLFSPVIVAGLGYEGLRAQLFTVPPYAVAYVVTLSVAFWSDKRHVRGLFACAAFGTASLCFTILGLFCSWPCRVATVLTPPDSGNSWHPLWRTLCLLDHRD